MSGTASARFYWSDWLSDPGVRMCSAATRGLWMDMLCYAAQAKGYFLINGRQPSPQTFARLTGTTAELVETALAELEENGVFSRDARGRIFCRRMVRDMKKAATARQNGSRSQGNPTLRKNNEIRTSDIQGSNQHPNQEPNRPTDQAPGIGNGIGKGNGFNIGEGREERAPSTRARAKPGRVREIPDDWKPNGTGERLAAELGRPPEWALEAGEEMRCWAKSNGARKVDWDATHLNWMRRKAREEEQAQARAGPRRAFDRPTSVNPYTMIAEGLRHGRAHNGTDFPTAVAPNPADQRYRAPPVEPSRGGSWRDAPGGQCEPSAFGR